METNAVIAIVVAVLIVGFISSMVAVKIHKNHIAAKETEHMDNIPTEDIVQDAANDEVKAFNAGNTPVPADYTPMLKKKSTNARKKVLRNPLLDRNISPVAAATAMTYRHRNVDNTPIIPGRDSPRAALAKYGSNLTVGVPPATDSVADTVVTDMVNEDLRGDQQH